MFSPSPASLLLLFVTVSSAQPLAFRRRRTSLGGIIAGIVIAGLAALVLCCLFFLALRRRRRNRNRNPNFGGGGGGGGFMGPTNTGGAGRFNPFGRRGAAAPQTTAAGAPVNGYGGYGGNNVTIPPPAYNNKEGV